MNCRGDGAGDAVDDGEARLIVMVQDVYLLMLHEPYESPGHPVPINAMIVHAQTLLHPSVPQPDGGRMYRCLTEFPSRTPGCLVPLSTLTFELDGGRLWPQVADWEAVQAAVVSLGRTNGCDAAGASARGGGPAVQRADDRRQPAPPGRQQGSRGRPGTAGLH